MDTVRLISPDGEIREVFATTEELTPLMVAGWVQLKDEKERENVG